MQTAAFLDTNIYLHFKPFEDIDWCSTLEAESVLIVIPRIVFAQLDKVKETGSTSKIRQRAKRVAYQLEDIISEDQAKIRKNVSVLFLPKAPSVCYEDHGLDPEVDDDRLLAAMLTYREDNHDQRIVLVSDDVGPRVKARPLQFEAQTLEDDLRLPSEPDPVESELRELRRKHQRLVNAQPELRIEFEDEAQHRRFTLEQSANTDRDATLDALLAEERKKWPKAKPDQASLNVAVKLSLVSADEIARYNQEVDDYLHEYEEYLLNNWEYEARKKRSLTLDLFLHNKGGAPSDDIDILLNFPDGFVVFDPEEQENPLSGPQPPKSPTPPKTAMEKLEAVTRFPLPVDFYRDRLEAPAFSNVSRPEIEESNGYRVSFHVQRLKQNLRERLPSLGVMFNSDDSIHSFSFAYLMNTIQLPENETGEMSVVVEVSEHSA